MRINVRDNKNISPVANQAQQPMVAAAKASTELPLISKVSASKNESGKTIALTPHSDQNTTTYQSLGDKIK